MCVCVCTGRASNSWLRPNCAYDLPIIGFFVTGGALWMNSGPGPGIGSDAAVVVMFLREGPAAV